MRQEWYQGSILIILHDLRGGGAERMMARLATALAEQGNNVTMVLLAEGGVSVSELSDKVKLIELGASRTLSSIVTLTRYLKHTQPNTILSALTHVNVASILSAFMAGMIGRLFVSERNTFSLDKKVNPSRIMRLTYWIAPKLYKKLPNPVIAVSKGVAQDLIHTEGMRSKDLVIAPNPVITPNVVAKLLEKPIHPWLIDSLNSFDVIVAVGRLSYQKGFDILIRAVNLVRQKREVRLVIFGEGDDREALTHLVDELKMNEIVDMPGYSPNPLAEMKAASVFVLSSRFEGSPNVLVEAMASGVAVVATDCPSGPMEILDQGVLAPLVPADNPEALSEGILKALKEGGSPALAKKADFYRDTVSARAYSQLFEGSVRISTGI